MKSFLLALCLILLSVVPGFTKDASFNVEFTLDPEYDAEVTKYVFSFTNPKTSIITTIMTITDATVRSFTTPVFDMPPGIPVPFVLTAFYGDDLAVSPDYMQRLIGKPVVKKMVVIK